MKDEIVIKKKTFVIVGIITGVMLVFIVGAYALHAHFRSPVIFLPDVQNVVNDRHEQPAENIDSNVSLDSLQEVSGGTAATAVSYENALQLYQGHIMAFDGNCRADPVILTLPPKNVVMFDNRSKWQRNIIVGPRQYTIAPYDYVLASFNIPGQYGVSCDSVQDVSIVSIQ